MPPNDQFMYKTKLLFLLSIDSPEPPAFIVWRHNDSIISYNSPRGGVSIIIQKGDLTTSFLLVFQAKSSDSGTYSCYSSLGQTASVNLNVLNGGYTSRLGTTNASTAKIAQSVIIILIFLLNISCWR